MLKCLVQELGVEKLLQPTKNKKIQKITAQD